MARYLTKTLSALQERPSQVRNVCILAHVDHGKTTLADSLISSNGLISGRLSGKMRYLDSRPDEQARGITMKSSAVSLHYGGEYLINLIDSPGHVDFSSEVSTALRLCDGALVLIDVVENVQPQTKIVLEQAWSEGVKPILVLNKIDRLFREMKLSPLEAYIHIGKVLVRANAIIGELFASKVLEGEEAELHEADDSDLYFSPDVGNVIFASAYDNWAFHLETFASIYSQKIGFSKQVLKKTLWGDYYVNFKEKKILKGALAKGKKPLFVQLVLENIWSVYEAVSRKDDEKLEKIVSSLSLNVSPRDLRSNDERLRLSSVFGRWLPLSCAVLQSVIQHVPSPVELSEERIEGLMCSSTRDFQTFPEGTKKLKKDFLKCSNDESAPLIVFVAKMFPVSKKQLPQNRIKPLTSEEIARRREDAREAHALKLAKKEQHQNEADFTALSEEQIEKLQITTTETSDIKKTTDEHDDTAFIAFARVYSGTLRPGAELYVLGPKHDPAWVESLVSRGETLYDVNSNLKNNPSSIMKARIGCLYLLLGRELEELDSVPAGNIVGIGGLEDYILKSATLCSDVFCPPFVETIKSAAPILRVALEPSISSELSKLVKGLHLLNQADANVQVLITEKGEHLLITAGEIHLERCLRDLKETYSQIDINVSEPIVPFRETIIMPPEKDMVNEQIEFENESEVDGVVDIETPDKQCSIRLMAFPLPAEVIDLLDKHSNLLGKVFLQYQDDICITELSSDTRHTLDDLRKELDKILTADDKCKEMNLSSSKIWAIGPRKDATNLLFNSISECKDFCIWKQMRETKSNVYKDYQSSFLNGFHMASLAGPLCDEPMRGVGFMVISWEIIPQKEDSTNVSSPYGPLSGQIISTVKEGCKQAFQLQPQRLMAAMYTCDITVKSEVLGKMYNVLRKRCGKIVSEKMIEGSSTFTVTASLPVAESLNFSNVIRKQTSGLAMPQLVFSHWEIIDIDPFWVPFTEEEILHFGDKADSENMARLYMNDIRKKKGLMIDEKIVEFAEKQRTISKKK